MGATLHLLAAGARIKAAPQVPILGRGVQHVLSESAHIHKSTMPNTLGLGG